MSNNEDQAMELEALESLFPKELKKVSDTEFSLVNLVPYSDNSQVNHVSVDITFSFPASYPSDDSVTWRLAKTSGCIATDSSRLEDLESTIRAVCDENLGCSCVYQIAERVQEWLRENNEEEKSLHDMLQSNSKIAVKQKKAPVVRDDDEDYDSEDDSDFDSEDYSEFDSDYESEDEEQFEDLQLKNLCPESERVTIDQFLEWKKEYDAYLLKEGLIKRISADDTRQTGKQQFLAVLKSRRADEDNEGETFNEELFGNEDDVDVDDLLDD
jgi:hypothetical protein